MHIQLVKNEALNNASVPYIAEVSMGNDVTHLWRDYRIPVYYNKHKENGYSAEIAGFQVASETAERIPDLMKYLIENLTNVARLPNYAFVARRAQRVYPVYTIEDEVMVVTPNGPIFRHVELAKVRQYLTEYLHKTRILGKDGKSDKLHVRGIDPNTLGLRRPVFYLKKRDAADGDPFWAPVFENGAQDGVYAYAASSRRDVAKGVGPSVVWDLRNIVAHVLVTDKRLSDDNDLRADRIMPRYWQKLTESMTSTGKALVADALRLPIYEVNGKFIAVERRENENRNGIYVGDTLADLEARVAKDMIRRGHLSNAGALSVEAADASDEENIANDDLTLIEGIGPKIANLLAEKDILTFATLASNEPDAIKDILNQGGPAYNRHDPTSWPEQAALAAAGDWDMLNKLQEELVGGKYALA